MPPAASTPAPTPPSGRILSVDALRGFDMFWLIGGNAVAAAVIKFCPQSVQAVLRPHLSHSDWEGFTFHDLIFPLFLFLVGMSAVFSLNKIVARDGKRAAYWRLLRRSVLLFLLGIVYNGGLSQRWPHIRLLGVLQRIALCYLLAGILIIHFRVRGLIFAVATILVGYWALLSFVPVPGQEAISFAPGANWTNYLDTVLLPGEKHSLAAVPKDTEKAPPQWEIVGLLSTLPAIATCLLGALAAYLLRSPRIHEWAKVGCLIGGGILSVALGFGWGQWFPVILQLWTSSYVLVAAGYSCILLGLFYAVIEVWGLQRWAIPFFWIGANAITLFMLRGLVDFRGLARRLVGGDLRALVQAAVGEPFAEPAGQLLLALVSFALVLALARFLYRRQIILRV